MVTFKDQRGLHARATTKKKNKSVRENVMGFWPGNYKVPNAAMQSNKCLACLFSGFNGDKENFLNLYCSGIASSFSSFWERDPESLYFNTKPLFSAKFQMVKEYIFKEELEHK